MRLAGTMLLACGLLLPARAAAQATQAQPAAPVSAEALALGRQVIELNDMAGSVEIAMAAILDAMQTGNPELAEYRDVVLRWARQIFTSEEAKAAFARVYAETFSEAELRELIVFFSSSVGRRYSASQGELSRRSDRVGEQLVQAHEDELMQMLEEANSKGRPRKN